MNGLFDSGSTKSSITSTPCSISGTARMEPSSKFERTTEISIFFDNGRRALKALGILFPFAKRSGDRKWSAPNREPCLSCLKSQFPPAGDHSHHWPLSSRAGQQPQEFLDRHANSDSGEVDSNDAKENEISLPTGLRPLSSYTTVLATGIFASQFTSWKCIP